MKLEDLLCYNQIVIQCHDTPDADAIGSGFALWSYFKEKGKDVRLVYGGRNRIRKSNLVLLIRELGIPIEYVGHLNPPELLITVDCQYGEGNVVCFPVKEIAVIDHHMLIQPLPRLNRVDNTLGSCCTLVWKMLKEANFDVNKNKYIATALYYGLYMDTGFMEEIYHMEDMMVRDTMNFDRKIMHKLRNSNISIDDLETAGAALLRTDYIEKYNFGLVKTSPCDPNVLGIISDLVLQVDAIDSCVVFALLEAGVKLSVRSCVEEIRANEMVMAICDGIGSGGGHVGKAGGFIPIQQATQEYLRICEEHNITPRMELDETGSQNRPSASGIKILLQRRANRYFSSIEYKPMGN